MSKVKQETIIRYPIMAVFGFIVILMVDALFSHMEYRNYNEKITILCIMLEAQTQGKDNLSTASELLKGEKATDSEYGKEMLRSYGYLIDYENKYSRELKKQLLVISAISLLLYLGFLLTIFYLYKREKTKQHEEMYELENILTVFRTGNYEISIPDINLNNDKNRIYDQIEALGEYLRLLKERMLKEKEDTKSLVTDISHQLKTPVAALKACFEILLQEDLKPGERKEFSDRCSQQLAGLEDLLTALINISRMETGMIQLKKDEASLYDTLVSAVNRIYLKAEEKQIDIGIEADEAMQKLKLMHDRKWLCEAFINLLDNSIKYSPCNTSITMRMISRTTFLRIEFEDQGIGIPREEYHQIFKRFYRGKSEEVKRESGSGIGLYLTREIINRHGGTITAAPGNSVTHTGSTFVIQLPYHP